MFKAIVSLSNDWICRIEVGQTEKADRASQPRAGLTCRSSGNTKEIGLEAEFVFSEIPIL
jgi:hypothetical protein